MSAFYFVEVLSRSGEVHQRHRVTNLPIKLGRAYDNDFILDDVHTAAHHAEVDLDEDGRLIMRDMGSSNGIVARGKRTKLLALDGNTVARLGQTNVRIRTTDFRVEDEALDTNNYGWEGWRPALLGVLMICIVSFYNTWVSDTEHANFVRYVVALAPFFSVALLWAGVWSFANRLFAGHARFGRHVFIAACGLFGLELWSELNGVLAFAFSWEFFTRYSSHFALAVGACLVYFHLCTMKPRNARRWRHSAMIGTVVGSIFILMSNYQRHGRLADELYMSDLFSPSIRVSKDHSVPHFITATEALKTRVDHARQQASEAGEPDGEDD